MGHPLKLLVFQGLLDGTTLGHRGGRTAGRLADAKDTKWTDFEPGWVGIFRFHGRPDFPTEGRLNEGLKGRLPTDSKGLGLQQKVIGKYQCCFHNMANRMGVRLRVKPCLFLGCFWAD